MILFRNTSRILIDNGIDIPMPKYVKQDKNTIQFTSNTPDTSAVIKRINDMIDIVKLDITIEIYDKTQGETVSTGYRIKTLHPNPYYPISDVRRFGGMFGIKLEDIDERGKIINPETKANLIGWIDNNCVFGHTIKIIEYYHSFCLR